MKILAWDTSSKTGALVALESDVARPNEVPRLITELTLNVDSTHSERLLWGIHQILESARWKLEDVDVFGVGVGPGSFTGLRIGLTTARTLAHAFKKPLVGVSSLAALARPVALHFAQDGFSFSTQVIAVTDACKGELFSLWGKAKDVAQGDSKVEEQVLSPESLMKEIQIGLSLEPSSRWVAVGEGRQRYSKEWALLPQDREVALPSPYLDHVQGRFLGQLVWESIQVNPLQDALEVHPRYLRASDAELKLKAGLLPPGPTRGLT